MVAKTVIDQYTVLCFVNAPVSASIGKQQLLSSLYCGNPNKYKTNNMNVCSLATDLCVHHIHEE